MNSSVKILSLLLLCTVKLAHAEWMEYYDPAHQGAAVTFSTSSIRRLDEVHYAVTVFTDYPAVQNAEVNKQKIEYLSKSETQFFGCETQDFALGAYELYRDRDALGSKTIVPQKELVWHPIAPGTLQMEFLKKFCLRR